MSLVLVYTRRGDSSVVAVTVGVVRLAVRPTWQAECNTYLATLVSLR